MALSEADKTRIREEEHYRHEFRASLGQPESRGERVLSFLSSGFVLWFLSAVVLTGIARGYATYEARLDERRERRQAASCTGSPDGRATLRAMPMLWEGERG